MTVTDTRQDVRILARPAVAAQIRALTGYLLRQQAISILVWGLALGAYDALVAIAYPAFKSSIAQELNHLTPSARALFGVQGTGTTIESWLAINTFNLLAPLALAFFAILIGARAIAGREEHRSMDLLLSNPVPRWVLLLATILATGLGLLGVLFLFGLLTWLSSLLINTRLSIVETAAAVLNLWPLCLFFGALALLCSALFRRSSLPVAVAGAVLVAMYVGQALASTSPSIRFLGTVSLFHYYGSAIEHGIPWASFIVISLIALLLVALAAIAFYRRDVYT